jgi:hypothetical protein
LEIFPKHSNLYFFLLWSSFVTYILILAYNAIKLHQSPAFPVHHSKRLFTQSKITRVVGIIKTNFSSLLFVSFTAMETKIELF